MTGTHVTPVANYSVHGERFETMISLAHEVAMSLVGDLPYEITLFTIEPASEGIAGIAMWRANVTIEIDGEDDDE